LLSVTVGADQISGSGLVVDKVTIGGGSLALRTRTPSVIAGRRYVEDVAQESHRVVGAAIFNEAESHCPNSSKDRDNSLSGWHKGAAWFALPLILLSPLTGLCMAFGQTFQSGANPARRGAADALRSVASFRDLSQVTSIGGRGGRMMARIFEGGQLRAYAVTPDGMTELPQNWPSAIHQGNWSAVAGSAINLVTSIILLGLLATGLLIWTRRKLRRPQGRGSEGRDRSATMGSPA